MRIRSGLAPPFVAALLLATPAPAQTELYDNGPLNTGIGWHFNSYLFASRFGLGGPATLEAVRFWTAENQPVGYTGTFLGSYYWAILADAAGNPGATLASGVTSNVSRSLHASGVPFGQYSQPADLYQNDFLLPSVSLGAGPYWLALHHGSLTATLGSIGWVSTTALEAGSVRANSLVSGDPDDFEFSEHNAGAFRLYGTVAPEPMSMALLGTGLVGLGALRRRRRTDPEDAAV